MKVGKPDAERVIVRVLKSTRDAKSGKIKYEVFESFDVFEAKPEAVYSVCYEAVRKA